MTLTLIIIGSLSAYALLLYLACRYFDFAADDDDMDRVHEWRDLKAGEAIPEEELAEMSAERWQG
jgi:hypothetical protein